MLRLPLLMLGGVLAAAAFAATAAEDPVATRKALMASNGGAAAVSGGFLKNEIAYDPTMARSVLLGFAATAAAFGDFFPEGSEDPANSKAAPAIWSDRAGFDAELAKYQAAAAAGAAAAGRDGPADLAAFQAAVQPVLGTCRSCHEAFQVRN